jgi:hypothetical protein
VNRQRLGARGQRERGENDDQSETARRLMTGHGTHDVTYMQCLTQLR